MRNHIFEENRFYILQNEGMNDMDIFLDEEDRARFLFLILYLQSPIQINNISWYSKVFVKNGSFRISPKITKNVSTESYLDVVSFNIKNKNFSILLCNKEEGCVSVYMQRILTSYSKYFNKKYKRKGHLFRGTFESHPISKSSVVETIETIHQNGDKWSSKEDYVEANRWPNLLKILKK